MQGEESQEALRRGLFLLRRPGLLCGACGPLDGAYCFQEIGTLTLYCATDEYCENLFTCLRPSDCPKS